MCGILKIIFSFSSIAFNQFEMNFVKFTETAITADDAKVIAPAKPEIVQ